VLPTRSNAQHASAKSAKLRLPDRPSYPHLFTHRNSYNFFSTKRGIILLTAISARNE
jgi:hypothetical protein